MLRILILAVALASVTVRAAEGPPSEESIREILAVTDVHKMVDGMFSQIDGMMMPSIQQAIGRPLTSEEKQTVAAMSSKMMTLMRDELSWDKMEALYIRIYRESFTQSEVDGMLAFYKSPAGAALIKKMPAVMQASMAAMQERMGPLVRKVQQAIQETAEEIKKRG